MESNTTVSLKSVFDTLMPIASIFLVVFLAAVGAIGYFIKRILDNVDQISKEVKPIRPAIIELQGLMTSKTKSLMFPLTVEPGSPLKLTEYGDKLLKESGFYEILERNADILVTAVKDKRPKSNYDIQEMSYAVIDDFLKRTDELLLPLKTYSFENGLDVEIFVRPAGVALRDKVMEKYRFDS